MLKAVKGIWDGQQVQLLEQVEAPPNTEVVVTFLEAATKICEGSREAARRLLEMGPVPCSVDTTQLLRELRDERS